jgi:Tfp pilus assembly protein PilV
MTAPRRDDDGFTLIELLITIAITVIIIGAIATALVTFLKNGTEALHRDDHSGGAIIASSYLDRDFASAIAAATTGSACSGVTNKLQLSWVQYTASSAAPSPSPDAAAGSFLAVYAVRPDTSVTPNKSQLERWQCKNGTVTDHQVLVRGLASTDVTVTTTGTCPSGTSPVRITLGAYSVDTGSDFAYTGCLKGRLG